MIVFLPANMHLFHDKTIIYIITVNWNISQMHNEKLQCNWSEMQLNKSKGILPVFCFTKQTWISRHQDHLWIWKEIHMRLESVKRGCHYSVLRLVMSEIVSYLLNVENTTQTYIHADMKDSFLHPLHCLCLCLSKVKALRLTLYLIEHGITVCYSISCYIPLPSMEGDWVLTIKITWMSTSVVIFMKRKT